MAYLSEHGLRDLCAATIVRERKEGVPGPMPMSFKQAVDDWQVFEIDAVRPLRLVNLSNAGLFWRGVPTDIVRGSDHEMSQVKGQAGSSIARVGTK